LQTAVALTDLKMIMLNRLSLHLSFMTHELCAIVTFAVLRNCHVNRIVTSVDVTISVAAAA